MKSNKLVMIASIVLGSTGLILACTDLAGTSFPNGKACQSSPCAYDEVTPVCFYCGIYTPGANCTKTPGTDYSASVQHYINGSCGVNGQCGGGTKDGDPFTIQCYYFTSPPCNS